MDELIKIYTLWSESQIDDDEIKGNWKCIMNCLIDYCSDEATRNIALQISDYSLLIQKQAFIAGFKQAFRIMVEIIS